MEHINNLETSHHLTWWDILVKSDLLNIAVLLIVLIYLGNRFLPKIIEERKKQISKELEGAKEARTKAENELREIQEKVKKVDEEVGQIKKEAKKTAEILKKQIEDDTEKELLKLKEKVEKEIISSQEEAIQDIKKSASEEALRLAEDALGKISKNEEIQKKLVDDFVAGLKSPDRN